MSGQLDQQLARGREKSLRLVDTECSRAEQISVFICCCGVRIRRFCFWEHSELYQRLWSRRTGCAVYRREERRIDGDGNGGVNRQAGAGCEGSRAGRQKPAARQRARVVEAFFGCRCYKQVFDRRPCAVLRLRMSARLVGADRSVLMLVAGHTSNLTHTLDSDSERCSAWWVRWKSVTNVERYSMFLRVCAAKGSRHALQAA